MSAAPLVFERVALAELNGDGMSLEVPAHQTVIVLGADHSGVDALGGYALALPAPPTGRVLVFDVDLARLPSRERRAARRRVGYLPAGDGLLHNLTLRDNIALPLRFGSDLSDAEIESRVGITCSMLRITRVADRRPAAVGEQERRRAALARALAFDPELVIMESPFDGLTARTAAEFLELARGGETGAGSRRTVFMTSQYLPSRLAPRIELRYRVERGTFTTEES